MKRAVKQTKRLRREPAEAKLLILKTAEKIMLEEGYAAVTVRRVAKSAGVSSTLLHYYYATADDLLVALYTHASEQDLESLKSALEAHDPLSALWAYQTDSTRTALGVEFLALANHRKSIRIKIVEFAERARALQANALSKLSAPLDHEAAACSPLCISMLMTSVSRNLIFESGVGISAGHAEARAFVAQILGRLNRKQKRP
jgi:AcrR family transcriptional regulator